MKIPVGEFVEKGLNLESVDIKAKVSDQLGTDFSGYFAVAVEGFSGIEEGILVIRSGEIAGAIFDYVKQGRTNFGDIAVIEFFNASKAKHGVMDICRLTRQQVDLIIAFNENIQISRRLGAGEIDKLIPLAYAAKYAEKAIGKQEGQSSKYEVLKKLGLSDFKG